jgi:hypothetical protein
MGRILDDVRATVLPFVGRLVGMCADHGALYVTTETEMAEYVGLVHHDVASTVERLRERGFTENALAAYKTIEGTSVSEQASLAWRGPRDELTDGADGLPDSDPLADRQLHIILFELDGRPGTTTVFAHWEYSWITHPIKHYRGTGVRDRLGASTARRFLEATELPFETPSIDTLVADR